MTKNLILIIMSMLTLGASAQTKNILPPAPTTREFNKYIDFDVSLYNGIPEINIPLYNIELRGVTIPVSLSYHASGIKFLQSSGNVGLGWVLNPGYRLSRTVYSFADELVPMPSDMFTALNNYENSAVTPQGVLNRDKYLSKFDQANSNHLFGTSDKLDGEYDQFTYSLPTESGHFLISDRTAKTIVPFQESNAVFEYNVGQSASTVAKGIIGFRVTDDGGNKYSFGEFTPQSNVAIEYGAASASSGGVPPVAWAITDIITPTEDFAKFKYVQGEVGTNSLAYDKVFQVDNAGGSCSVSETSNPYPDLGYYKTIFPSEITTKNEKVVFNHSIQTNKNKLNSIQVYTQSGSLIKTIKFYYHDGYYDSNLYYLLDSVTITGSNASKPTEVYKFNYKVNPFEGSKQSTRDQWGYIMPGNPDNAFHSQFSNDPVELRSSSDIPSTTTWPLSNLITNFGERELSPTSNVPDTYSLKKIIYPTGGYSEYEYENNVYSDGTLMTAGIRIKKISKYDPVSAKTIMRTYKYGLNESGYGQASIGADHRLFVKEGLKFSWIECQHQLIRNYQRSISYSTTMVGDAATDVFQSGFVSYPEVTEYFSDSSTGIGKIKHSFNVGNEYTIQSLSKRTYAPNNQYGEFFPINIATYRLWNKPYLSRRDYYDQNNSAVKTELFNYQSYDVSTFTGLKVKTSVSYPSLVRPEDYYDEFGAIKIPSFFDYGAYTIVTGKRILLNKNVSDYVNGNTLTTNYIYEYSNNLISKETVTKSNGESYINYTTYPLDYATGTPFIDAMRTNRLLKYPIEQVKSVLKGSNEFITSGTITNYKLLGKGLPDTEWSLETSAPIASSTFKFSNRSLGILPPAGTQTAFSADNRFKKKMSYDLYDNNSNLIQRHGENAPSDSYIWGYNQQYPVAHIINSAASDYAYTSFETKEDKGNWEFTNTFIEDNGDNPNAPSSLAATGSRLYQLGATSIGISKSGLSTTRKYILSCRYFNGLPTVTGGTVTLKANVPIGNTNYCEYEITGATQVTISSPISVIDELRLYPKDAQMTTYTYEPLVGITSMTDAKCKTTYYEYDDFQRLRNIKDAKRNILKNYCYNYAGQQTGCPISSTTASQSLLRTSTEQTTEPEATDSQPTETMQPGNEMPADDVPAPSESTSIITPSDAKETVVTE